MKQLDKILPIIFFAALSFAIILPLVSPGYILTLDMVTTPKIPVPWPRLDAPSFLFGGILFLLNSFIEASMIQKILLFLIFFLSGWGMYRLVPVKNILARYFAGLLYMINPFVYERLMDGQLGLLLGFGLFPFVVSAILNFFKNPSLESVAGLSILSTFLFAFAGHYILIYSAFFIIFGTIFVLLNQDKITNIGKYLLIFLGLLFILNANWIAPVLKGEGELAYAISSFDSRDLIAFQSVGDRQFGLIFNILSLFGYWGENEGRFILSKEVNSLWPAISVIFISLSLVGVYVAIKKRKSLPLSLTLIILSLLSLDFACGIALNNSSTSTFFWLYEKIPILRGLREPQKLVAVIVLTYAIFSALAIEEILVRFKKMAYLGISLLFLPFLYTPTMLFGFFGQLRPVSYPKSWFTVDQILKEDRKDFKTLFFPWHLYMKFNFANNRIIVNPASSFFEKPVLTAQNYEMKALYSHDERPEALHVEGLLKIEKEGTNFFGEAVPRPVNFGQALSPIDVKYIILGKDEDWGAYRFLDESPDLGRIFESKELILYRNLSWEETPL